MYRIKSVFMIAAVLAVYSSADDLSVVQAVLDSNSLSWSAEEVSEVQGGRVVKLDLSNRDFPKSGIKKLPSDIGKLTELKELIFEDNSLTSVPKEIGELKNLRVLSFASNDIYSLPETIGKLSELRELYLKSNELDKLPSSIKNLKKLRILHMWANRFETLPPEIGELKGLQELYLQDNRLRNLPEEITKLELSYIDIQDNKLCGLKGKVHTWLENYDDEYKKLQRCQDEVRFQ